MSMSVRAAVLGIEVDSKQAYLFESDKLREMVGASRLMAMLPVAAERLAREKGKGIVHVFHPVSGDVRLWAQMQSGGRDALLDIGWMLKEWLNSQGIAHTTAYLECDEHHFTHPSHRHLTGEQRRSDLEPDVPSLSWVNARLSRRLAERKLTNRSDARPSNSFFAPCLIYGSDAANHWNPSTKEVEERRRLVGTRAKSKLEARNTNLQDFYRDNLTAPVTARIGQLLGDAEFTPPRSLTFKDLADDLDSPASRGDSFIAFLCADADDMGRLLPLLNWNHDEAWGDGRPAWERNRAFIVDLDQSVKQAFHTAIAHVAVPDRDAAEIWRERIAAGRTLTLPVLPQLLGGDDLWTVSSKVAALDLSTTFSKCFSQLVGAGMVQTAVNVAERSLAGLKLPALTMSVGVAFAKYGHPAYAMAEAAEQLLKQAKERRKGQTFRGQLENPEGCIDWHIVESSLVESVDVARESGWRYTDSVPAEDGIHQTLLLTTRPWTVSETEAFLKLRETWLGIPRRKREQVEDLLRRGGELSRLAWTAWLQRLQNDELANLRSVVSAVPDAMRPTEPSGPWREIPRVPSWPEGRWAETPFLDLLALSDLLPQKGRAVKGHPDGDARN